PLLPPSWVVGTFSQHGAKDARPSMSMRRHLRGARERSRSRQFGGIASLQMRDGGLSCAAPASWLVPLRPPRVPWQARWRKRRDRWAAETYWLWRDRLRRKLRRSSSLRQKPEITPPDFPPLLLRGPHTQGCSTLNT